MHVEHHPSEELLSDFANGRLDEGQSLAIATHVENCALCRMSVRALEQSAGEALEAVEPVSMIAGAIEKTMQRLGEPARVSDRQATANSTDAWLPAAARRYERSSWKWVAPGVSMQPILLPGTSPTRVFLLKSAKGTSMLQHTHSGIEMTCVLAGSFSHEGGVFRRGDFDFGDESVDHQPLVSGDEVCVCLVAMTGELKLKGLFGRLMQPFIRL